MKFLVTFTTQTVDESLVASMGEPGLDVLDAVREDHPEIKNLSANDTCIYSECPINGHIMEMFIDEPLARKSGLFRARMAVEVKCQEHSFGKYIKSNLDKRYCESVIKPAKEFEYFGSVFTVGKPVTERVLSKVIVTSVFDHESMLKDWENAGFPTDWEV